MENGKPGPVPRQGGIGPGRGNRSGSGADCKAHTAPLTPKS